MHYKNGREAKEADQVVFQDIKYSKKTYAGTLHTLLSGSETCNAQLAVAVPGGISQMCVTIGECFHAEDAVNSMDPVAKNDKPVS